MIPIDGNTENRPNSFFSMTHEVPLLGASYHRFCLTPRTMPRCLGSPQEKMLLVAGLGLTAIGLDL